MLDGIGSFLLAIEKICKNSVILHHNIDGFGQKRASNDIYSEKNYHRNLCAKSKVYHTSATSETRKLKVELSFKELK